MFFFFNDTATTEIYTLSLHDALPICLAHRIAGWAGRPCDGSTNRSGRSEEHTSELQSPCNIVCRLLLEKKILLGTSLLAPMCSPALGSTAFSDVTVGLLSVFAMDWSY